MTLHDAQNLLDRCKAGESMPQAVINKALELTGDLEPDILQIAIEESQHAAA